MAHFKTQARVLELLGEQQIANCPTAISELFKNAHDAYATRANLDVYPDDDRAVLWDNGKGMSESDLTDRWLVVGTSAKITSDRSEPPRVGFIPRPIQGEKGIGRLAISTIGESLLLVSKVAEPVGGGDRYSALFLNWNISRNLDLILSDIEIPTVTFGKLEELETSVVRYMVDAFRASLLRMDASVWAGRNAEFLEQIQAQLDSFRFDPQQLLRTGLQDAESGTAFCICHLKPEIGHLVASPARDGEPLELNIELVQLLSNFRNRFARGPQEGERYDFDVDVRRWENASKTFSSVFTDWQAFDSDDLRSYDHKIDVHFDEWGRVSGTLEVFGKPVQLDAAEVQGRRRLSCGPFSLRLWYYQGQRSESRLDDETFALIERKLAHFGGLMMYRDGLRVLPYGRPEYDWLTFEERRSRRAGRYFFSYRRLFGFVSITDKGNPQLRDKSGREGLIENDAYRQMRQTLVDFFRDLAIRYFFKNAEFEAAVSELATARGAVAQQQRKATERRERLRDDLRNALEHMATSESAAQRLAESALTELATLPNPTAADLTEVLGTFRQRMSRIEGPSRTAVPGNLSLARDRTTKAVLAEYRERKKIFDAACAHANTTFTEQVRIRYPDADEAVARNKLLKDARFLAQAKVGRAFADLKAAAELQLGALGQQLDSFRGAQLGRIDEALLGATSAATTDEALLCNEDKSAPAITAMETAVTESLAAITEKRDRLSEQLTSLLDGSGELLVAAQTDAIEELNEEVNRNLELVQLGLSVEIIDHELNKLYRGTKAALKKLAAMARTSASAATAVEQVRANFQHLEQRYKLMSPLYRGSYRTKAETSGVKILAYVRSFLSDSLAENDVELKSTARLGSFSILEAHAVVLPVFVNVVDNAIYWLRDRDERRIELDLVEGVVTICDTGPGIEPDLFDDVFTPFFSNKPNGRGLGLYVARANLRRHGHDIWVSNDPKFKALSGACICIRFNAESVLSVPESSSQAS